MFQMVGIQSYNTQVPRYQVVPVPGIKISNFFDSKSGSAYIIAQMLAFGKILDQYIGFFLYWGRIQKEADTCILVIGLAKFHVKDLENLTVSQIFIQCLWLSGIYLGLMTGF